MTSAIYHTLSAEQKAQLGPCFTQSQLNWHVSTNRLETKNPFAELFVEPTQDEVREDLCREVTENIVKAWKGTRKRIDEDKNRTRGLEDSWRSGAPSKSGSHRSHWSRRKVVHKKEATGADRENWRVPESSDQIKLRRNFWVKK